MSKQTDFIDSIKDASIAAMRGAGILASLTISQAILESGWGDHAPGNNLFGIKAGKEWAGATQQLNTTESVNGQTVAIVDTFRTYGSLGESLADHTALLTSSPRYANILRVTDAGVACRLILADGYATEPDYADQLIGIIGQYNLTQYDDAPLQAPVPAQAPAAPAPAKTYGVTVAIHGFMSADDAQQGLNPVNAVQPGQYNIFNEHNGMINVSTDGGAGSWINPANMQATPAPQTVTFKNQPDGKQGQWNARGGPATHFAAIAIVKSGIDYELIDTTADGWSHIKLGLRTAYVGPAAR